MSNEMYKSKLLPVLRNPYLAVIPNLFWDLHKYLEMLKRVQHDNYAIVVNNFKFEI